LVLLSVLEAADLAREAQRARDPAHRDLRGSFPDEAPRRASRKLRAQLVSGRGASARGEAACAARFRTRPLGARRGSRADRDVS